MNASSHGDTPGRRVLVVDDNVDAIETLAMLLESFGHEVTTATSGAEALRTAAEWHPEVVLLDIGLPGMSGYEVAQAMREARLQPEPLLVALSGYMQDESKGRFDHHLLKPANPQRILDLLASI